MDPSQEVQKDLTVPGRHLEPGLPFLQFLILALVYRHTCSILSSANKHLTNQPSSLHG